MNKTLKLLFVSVFILGLLACNALAAPATPTTVPTSTSVPTATVVPLYQQVTVSAVSFSDSGKSPDYNITAQIPSLTGSDDPRATAFTTEMHNFLQGLVSDFKTKLAQNPLTPITAASYFDVRYQLVSPPGNVLSIKVATEGYFAGAAHPYHLIYSFNYDLEQGKNIAFSSLFLPNADYLSAISQYCIAQLKTRDIGFGDIFAQGAEPTLDNYKNWNITPDGLMITFDEYQVASYATGPQVVTIPYSELKSLIDPKGPLGSFIK